MLRFALRRRGISVRQKEGGFTHELLQAWPLARLDHLYQEMQRYSFRLVLRDVIRLGQEGELRVERLTRHVSMATVTKHLDTLCILDIVRAQGTRYALNLDFKNLGPLCEWFVAEILRRELGFSVAWGVPLRGGKTGGDLDVVAEAEGRLVYVEVKSGPPKHIQEIQIAAFLDRIHALAPFGAIFLEDTELRMADKIVGLFEEVLKKRGIDYPVERVEKELFRVGSKLFIANAQPSMLRNIEVCVKHFFRGDGMQLSMDLRS